MKTATWAKHDGACTFFVKMRVNENINGWFVRDKKRIKTFLLILHEIFQLKAKRFESVHPLLSVRALPHQLLPEHLSLTTKGSEAEI